MYMVSKKSYNKYRIALVFKYNLPFKYENYFLI